jgi:multiple sugar transport system substrate-binding protein
MKKNIGIFLFAALLAFLSGCSNDSSITSEGQDQAKKISEQPVTVTFGMAPDGYLSDEEFNRFVVQAVAKKYPWITVSRIPYGGDAGGLTKIVASGEVPDVIVQNNINGVTDYLELGLGYSLTDMIKKYNVDMSRFEPVTLDTIRAVAHQDELVGLPYTRHFNALYFNKELFDKFGTAYPKDGMTWDDAYELARKMTRKQDNVQYRGLETDVIERIASQLSLPYIDSKSNMSVVNTDEWKKVLQFVTKIHQIPGNEQISNGAAAKNLFTKDQTLAMLAGNNIIFNTNLINSPDYWDIASLPIWKEAPGLGFRVDEHLLSITATSKHKDEAFLVLATVVSDEVQMDLSRQGHLSVLKDQKIRDAFGADWDFLKGKNMQAIYKTTPAKSFIPTKYDKYGVKEIHTALDNMVKQGMDANTALRIAEEAANQEIKAEEGSK